ncbi:MAG: hypothetical protein LCH54_09090 [Bacteroidetes bacterium]|nr:hypothetical protein [Bacteroidota bacterium]
MTVLNSKESRIQHLTSLTDHEIQAQIRLLNIEIEVEKRLTEGKIESKSSLEFMSGLIFYFLGFFILISSIVFISGLYFFGILTAFLIYGSMFILTGLYLLFFKPSWFGNGLQYWYRQFKGESES